MTGSERHFSGMVQDGCTRAVCVDTHVHLYGTYNLDSWYGCAVDSLARGGASYAAVVVLDREGQCSRDLIAAHRGWVWRSYRDLGAGVIDGPKGRLYVIFGAQYVAQERIEIVGIGEGRLDVEHEPAAKILRAIADHGACAVLPWSPGKWTGARKNIVRSLIDASSPASLVLGDIAIRPRLLPEPELLRTARTRGFRILLGSDPLPFEGEERLVGALGEELLLSAVSSEEEIVAAIGRALTRGAATKPYGSRNSLLRGCLRFVRSNVRGKLIKGD